jgi:hypothetical protein
MVFCCDSFLRLVHYLSNVHTWAVFFLPALSPIWGPRPKLRRPEEVVYSPNDNCSHFTQCLFPPKLPQQHTCTIFSICSLTFILIIHHIQANIYTLLLQEKSFHHFFSSSWQADCSRSLVSYTITIKIQTDKRISQITEFKGLSGEI